MSEVQATPDAGAGHATASPCAEHSRGYYIFLIVIVLLMGETTVHGAVLFYTALPYLAPSFSAAQLPWIVTVTLLLAAAAQPLMGKLADVFGRRRLLLWVAALYIAGSVLGALAADSFVLILVARVLQASAVALPGVVYSFFREYLPRRMVPVAVGLNSTNIGVSVIAAPFIAGALLSGSRDYHAIFWFCAIYMAVVAPVVYFFIPDAKRSQRQAGRARVDVLGSALFTLGAGLLLFGVTEGASVGWGTVAAAVPLTVGVLGLVAFVVVEYRVENPMIDMRLLGGDALGTTMVVSLLAGVIPISWSYVVPQMLETAPHAGIDYGFGLTATMVGVVTLSNGILSMACGPLGGYLAKRLSPRAVMALCCATGVAGTVLIAFWHDRLWHFVVFGLVLGISHGFYYAAGPNLVIEAVPPEMTGVSTGLQSFTGAFAGSVMPVVIAAVLSANIIGRSTGPIYSSDGYTYVFLLLAASGLIAFAVTLFMRHGRRPATGGAISDYH